MTKSMGMVGAIAVFAVLACSSKSSGNSGGGAGATCLASQGGASSQCISCGESQCGSQLSGLESGCSDLIACECPGGTYNPSLEASCAPKAEESSCTSANSAFGDCLTANCDSQCATGADGG